MINFVIGYFTLFIFSLLAFIWLKWYLLLVLVLIFGYVFLDELILYIKRKRDTYKLKQIIKESWK